MPCLRAASPPRSTTSRRSCPTARRRCRRCGASARRPAEDVRPSPRRPGAQLRRGGVAAVGDADGAADAEAALGEVQAVAHGAADAVVRHPADQRRVDPALRGSGPRPAGRPRCPRSAVTIAVRRPKQRRSPRATLYSPPPSQTRNVAGGADAALAGIEAQHHLAEGDGVVAAVPDATQRDHRLRAHPRARARMARDGSGGQVGDRAKSGRERSAAPSRTLRLRAPTASQVLGQTSAGTPAGGHEPDPRTGPRARTMRQPAGVPAGKNFTPRGQLEGGLDLGGGRDAGKHGDPSAWHRSTTACAEKPGRHHERRPRPAAFDLARRGRSRRRRAGRGSRPSRGATPRRVGAEVTSANGRPPGTRAEPVPRLARIVDDDHGDHAQVAQAVEDGWADHRPSHPPSTGTTMPLT